MKKDAQDLLENLTDAVLFVSADGVVRFGNRVALTIFHVNVGQKLPSDVLCQTLNEVAQGFLAMPLEREITVAGDAGYAELLRVRILEGGQPGVYTLVAHNFSETRFYENTLRNFSEMLNAALLTPFQVVTGVLDDLERTARELNAALTRCAGAQASNSAADQATTPLTQTDEASLLARLHSQVQQLKDAGGGFIERAGQLALLSQAYSRSAMTANERITVQSLLAAALAHAAPVLQKRAIVVK